MRTILSIAAVIFAFANAAHADIFQWEYINPADPSQGKQQSTTLCPDGAGVDAVPGAYLAGRDLTMAYLIGADLSGANFSPWFDDAYCQLFGCFAANVTDADFSQANLTNANFEAAPLTRTILTDADLRGANFSRAGLFGADFTGADIREARFGLNLYRIPSGTGISLAQLYSTASYQAHDLRGIDLGGNYLSGGNFAGQNLMGSNFGTGYWHRYQDGTGDHIVYEILYATLSGADFTGADTRGAAYLDLSSATTTNLIWPDSHINGLNLDADGLLVVRDIDWPIPISVDQHLAMGPGGTLRMVFEADAWDATVSFAPGIPVTLGGTLELTFAADVNPASQVGRTFDLFNWTGVNPTGAFAISSPYRWDLSNLYTTGEITLTAIPEPASIALAIMCVLRLATRAWRGFRIPRSTSRVA